MAYNGWPKVIPAGGLRGNHFVALDHFAHFVQTLGMPHWLGYVSALTEFLGGIFLILGFLTRFCAFLVTINMLAAIILVHFTEGIRRRRTRSLSLQWHFCSCSPVLAKLRWIAGWV
ncbi:MAG: hypothetical protein NVSMB62_13470 [Acidobacteriaceae bacterium]